MSDLALPGLLLSFGLCFFYIRIPDRQGLKGYRMARRMMGAAYLLCFVALLAENVSVTTVTPSVLQQLIIVTIACLQAFFFTYALTTLIDVQFFTWRRMLAHLSVVLIAPVLSFLLLALQPDSSFTFHSLHFTFHSLLFTIFSLFYLCLLVYYVSLFRRYYRKYESRMADYFSDDERQRLLWVKRSFFLSLFIGILALLFALRPSVITSLLFSVVMICYYAAFAIRFINYAFTFHQIESAMEPVVTEESGTDETKRLMERLNDLMTSRRLYTKPDLTIEELAVQIGESHRLVSAAINSGEGTNFKSWVNTYRINEAVRLIREGYLSTHTTDALATAVGFANRINFYRVFKKSTGHSPTDF